MYFAHFQLNFDFVIEARRLADWLFQMATLCCCCAHDSYFGCTGPRMAEGENGKSAVRCVWKWFLTSAFYTHLPCAPLSYAFEFYCDFRVFKVHLKIPFGNVLNWNSSVYNTMRLLFATAILICTGQKVLIDNKNCTWTWKYTLSAKLNCITLIRPKKTHSWKNANVWLV